MKKSVSTVLICFALLLGLVAGFFAASDLYYFGSRGLDIPFGASFLSSESAAFKLALPGSAEKDATEIYELACRQTVGVTAQVDSINAFGQPASSSVSGTGFIVTEDGYIMTNYHIVETAFASGSDVTVRTYDGRVYTAEIVGCQEDDDVAVLKIKARGLDPALIGDSDSMKVGERIYAVGHPLGQLTYTMTAGIISALDRVISVDTGKTAHVFQVDAAINNGNSGGPVYNSRGEVIGIVTAKYSSSGIEGLGFAIPISEAADDAAQIIKYGYVPGRPSLGIDVSSLSSGTSAYYGAGSGVYVNSVDSASCSEAAGIKAGDMITAIDEAAVTDESSYSAALKEHRAGDSITVTLIRSGKTMKVDVTLDEAVPLSKSERSQQFEQQNQQNLQNPLDDDFWGFGDFPSWFDGFLPFWMN